MLRLCTRGDDDNNNDNNNINNNDNNILCLVFLCNTERKFALDWALTSCLRNILVKLQDIHVLILHYNTFTHFYIF